MAPGSRVIESNFEVVSLRNDYKVMGLTPDMSDEKLGTIVQQKYHGLAVLAQVSEANRISLSLPTQASAATQLIPSTCDLSSSRSISDNVVAFFVQDQEMYGCFHTETMMPVDVHIIDLDFTNMNRVFSSESQGSMLPVIIFSMTPRQDEKGEVVSNAPRNLTVILKSSRPVRWYLESWRLTGYLKVISNNGPVENHSPSAGLILETERKPLAEDFERLWRQVVNDTGIYPMSYVQVMNANVISMVIPPTRMPRSHLRGHYLNTSNQKMTSNFVPDRESLHDAPDSHSIPDRILTQFSRSSKFKIC